MGVTGECDPGHDSCQFVRYGADESMCLHRTGSKMFFSGDFLMPARLLIDDTGADLASAQGVTAFVRDRPVSFVLGGHIEMDTKGDLFPWESQFHPNEHVLQMKKDDLLALPAAIRNFNGFYSKSGSFIMMNSIRVLIAEAILVLVAVVVLVWILIRLIRRHKRTRKLQAGVQS